MKKMFVILAALFAVTAVQADIVDSCVDPCNSEKAWICHKNGNSGTFGTNHVSRAGEFDGHDKLTHQGHADFCAFVSGTCNLAASGLNVYKDMTISCVQGPPPTPTPFDLDLPCAGGLCETSILSSASFDFAIASGGVNQDLYVCEVGFRENDCPTCNAGVDKIVVHLWDAQGHPVPDVTIPYPGHALFGMFPQALTSDVYLNSLDYSAGWYVRYCSKTTRLVVGTTESDLAARIKASIKVDASENSDNGYLAQAKVKFAVTHECNGADEAFAPVVGDAILTPHGTALVEPGAAIEIKTEDFLCLNGTSCGKEMCNWVVHFQETACTLRKIKDVTCVEGVLDCTPYKANIHTTINLDTSLECLTTGCVQEE